MKGLCEDAENLCNVLRGVADTVKKRVDGIPRDSPDRVAVEIALHTARSLDLNTRIDGLKRWAILISRGCWRDRALSVL